MMNLLAIDIGNSRCKSCFGHLEQGFPDKTLDAFDLSEIENHFRNFSTFDACVISCVNVSVSQTVRKALGDKVANGNLVFLNSKNSPIALKVEHPETLGADRIAAAIGAYKRNATQTIVVDSGTAVTIDRVDGEGAFCGGTIFPGINLALNSLAKGTSKLPRIDAMDSQLPDSLGTDTLSAIQSGVFWGHIGATERIVKNIKAEFGNMSVYVTGGNGSWINRYADFENVYCESLVLEGLWEMGTQLLNR